ncbi:MAG: calcium/sodium antiporter [Defluviitaleaceae bacterium]|nr:calcium/sodium antiporter [Defluviitaleaceae bacterium]
MGTVLQVLGLLLGFAMLIKGADIFVGASANIAKWLGIPKIVVGLTIVSMGTSAPEAVISIVATLNGSNALAVGNVIGSNIFNLLMSVGLCAMVMPIATRFKDIARDYWISVGAAVTLFVMMVIFSGSIPRFGAAAFLAFFVVYMVILVRQALKNKNLPEDEPDSVPVRHRLPAMSIVFAMVGVALIIAGGHVAVINAEKVAVTLGMTERVIGLTIIAIGTSLPELVISLVACRKGENDMAIGNIIGSNIFNILFVLGLSGTIMPLVIDSALKMDLGVLIVGSLAFLLFAVSGKRIVRLEGFVLVGMYVAYMVFVIL